MEKMEAGLNWGLHIQESNNTKIVDYTTLRIAPGTS